MSRRSYTGEAGLSDGLPHRRKPRFVKLLGSFQRDLTQQSVPVVLAVLPRSGNE